ncbi:uncharacterized protein atf7ip2 [Pseudoliparis swirei]|uniref:uncharacterized protein atf7ip2 n=1 Tax=Pseudoliparis swirei TaxID=2059687 RepID=UPI0024BDDDBA|nr:uncharacterized protein atf7ip2 [Pseudoliparis swirei]XP_056263887.1 uncharacterized protein atf7ip2 [Pseudoliparis swirei]
MADSTGLKKREKTLLKAKRAKLSPGKERPKLSPGKERPKPSPGKERPKLSPGKERSKPSSRKEREVRTRVDIGMAIEPWRRLKALKGWKTDAEVAQRLLNVTKKLKAKPPQPAAAAEIKFTQSEMQTLIEQEVDTAVQKKGSKLQRLMETIQQLDRAVDYENSIQKLETRINTVTKRAEAAIAFMMNPEKKENTKQALENMEAAKEVLKDATREIKKEEGPPVLTPHCSPELKVSIQRLKTKPKVENTQWEEPKLGPVKAERLPLGESAASSEQVKPPYPPLPTKSFPKSLDAEAASYSVPPRPLVRLAAIQNAGVTVLWNAERVDGVAPPMDNYSIFTTMENRKGSNVFPDWIQTSVDPEPLPMCLLINKFKPGRKVCVAVAGKDTFGRFGPYSNVATASLPD